MLGNYCSCIKIMQSSPYLDSLKSNILKIHAIVPHPIYMLNYEKLIKLIFILASTTEYMTKAMEKMKDDYKPIKQTGSEYSLKQRQNGGSSSGTWSAMSNSNMFPGMGSLSGIYSFGGSTSRIINGGNGMTNMKIMPQYNGINKSPFTSKYT